MKTKVEFLAAALLLTGAARAGWTPPESSVTPPAVVTLDVFLPTYPSSPHPALAVGGDGALYGSTYWGGRYGYPYGLGGTLFRLATDGAFRSLHDFGYLDGGNPSAALLEGPDGALYGSTYHGGEYNNGTLFRLETNGTFTKLHDFVGNLGAFPSAALVVGADGALYGSTSEGGYGPPFFYGYGTLFRFATDGTFTKLHDFTGPDGAYPSGALVAGPDGALYGSTPSGGASGFGTLFRLATNGTFTKLHDFNGTNGANPQTALVAGPDGAFYGSTYYGGTYGTNGYGTLFRLTTGGTLTKLHDFTGADGANPQAALVAGPDGALYGSTYYGGSNGGMNGYGYGTLFRLATNGTFTKLHDFNGTNGANPQTALVAGLDYALYGLTPNRVTAGGGRLFKIVLNRAPIAKCRNATLSASANCTVTVSPADVDDGSYDPDAGDSITAAVSPTSLTGSGWHTVILTVTDNHGAASTCVATVTVQDTTPPGIACPNNIVANAVSPSGAVVSFPDPAASDNCSLASVISSPASGGRFAIGDTRVSCTATDGAGNQVACAFTVHVRGSAEQINNLFALVRDLDLPLGTAKSLIVKLEAVASALNRGDIEGVCGSLGALLNETNAQNGKKLKAAQADWLMTEAARVRAVAGCR